VGAGSSTPPRLIIMEYTGNKNDSFKTALIGKGITFDSGGQNLKPTGHIETMRSDMAGASIVLGVINALVELKAPVNVTGVIAAAHNAIGANAFFPGDIYKSYSGKTIEICSTDAEGRLVLADAISYCINNFKPDKIIDFATLTGAVVTALGEIVAGLFSNNDTLAAKLFDAGEICGERLWRLPMYKMYCDSIKSDIADLRNLSKFKKGTASSITAAAFLKEFVGDIPWAHIDIAGTAFNEGAACGEIPQFATGFGVRLFLEYVLGSL
ncbi:MAG: M17 family metallopeptidase, partial [Fibrobacter sp.]|nr:M17 family metallopeptidase [Fibrobacter sp.]